jgi:glycosyltransferase involved in cell wall biosynthesis
MRLLQICTNFRPGGIQHHVLGLTEWLRSRGHIVALAGAPGAWMDSARDPQLLPLPTDRVGHEGGSLGRRLGHAAAAAAELRRFIRSERFDLIHAHESAPALTAYLATMGKAVPRLLTYHGSEPDRVEGFARMAGLAADVVITPSHRSAGDLHAAGLAAGKLTVLGLGVPQRPPPDPAEVRSLRRELLGDGRVLVLTVARLAHQKGIDLLVEVAREVVRRDPGVRFAVVGDGPQRDLARRWAAEAGVERHLAFVGHSDQARQYMVAADLFRLTSRWEALPITIVEAFQEGLPVVASDGGGVRELVDREVGAVVGVGEVEDLV